MFAGVHERVIVPFAERVTVNVTEFVEVEEVLSWYPLDVACWIARPGASVKAGCTLCSSAIVAPLYDRWSTK